MTQIFPVRVFSRLSQADHLRLLRFCVSTRRRPSAVLREALAYYLEAHETRQSNPNPNPVTSTP